MRQEYDFDLEKNLKNALTSECAGLTVSRDVKERIDDKIRKEADMKHLSVKKLVIGVAAGCLLVSGAAFATGHAVSLSTHTYHGDGYKNYSDMSKAESELGYPVDSVEAFDNGYQFRLVNVTDVQGKDADGNAVYTFKRMNIDYGKGSNTVILYIEKPVETPVREKEPDAVREIEGVTVYYDSYNFMVVPPDYELTAEEKAKQESGEIVVSYGSAKVETQQSQDVTWDKEGVHYHMLGFDLGLSGEEMLDMAEEIITANK